MMNNSYNIQNGKGEIETSWWRRRSKLEKTLTILSILALLLIIVLVVVITVFFTRPSTVCLSESCIHVSNQLLDHIDTTADPCDDFYRFSCGTFMDNVQLDDEYSKSVDSLIYDTINDRMRGIIEEPIDDDDPKSIVNAKKLFSACMNLTAIEERGLRLIKDSLRQMGGWPALEGNNWKEKDFDWMKATYKLRELGYGFEFFIQMNIDNDEHDNTKRIIELSSPRIAFVYAKPEEEEQFYNFFVNVSVAFGVDRNRARNELREVIDFMKGLFTKPDEDKEEEKYDPLTISELRYKFRDIAWLDYINRLRFPTPNITYDQIVSVTDTPYFLRLQTSLRRATKRVLANYIAIQTILDHSTFMTREISDIAWKFYQDMNSGVSVPPIPPRHEYCSEIVHYTFSLTMQAAYIEKHFSKEEKEHAYKILQSIKDEFRNVLNRLEWMDKENRINAIERLSTSRNYVGYPNDLLNYEKVEEQYIGYQMEEDNFLACILNAKYYETNVKFARLLLPVGKDEELNEGYSTYTRPYYSASDNTIMVPAGALQGVLYNKDRPQYLNYGSIGSTMGHQTYHTVFDEKSCRSEAKYYDWLSTTTLLEFNNKLSCVAMHYGKYYVPEIQEHLNSSNTKNEDIADIAGVQLAYNAYNNWVQNNGEEPKLPGFNYTPKQLFWIASAVRFCSKRKPESMERSVLHNYRSLKKYRVYGTLRNSPDFAKDFHCSSDSYMNSEEKCNPW